MFQHLRCRIGKSKDNASSNGHKRTIFGMVDSGMNVRWKKIEGGLGFYRNVIQQKQTWTN
jgi:hypothetical protein